MADFEMATDAEISEDLYPDDFAEPADGHMAGLSASDRAKYGIGVGEGNYDVKNEGHAAGLSMTDRLRREGKPGPLDRVEQDGTTSRRREVSNEPDPIITQKMDKADPVAQQFTSDMSGKLPADALEQVLEWHALTQQQDMLELRRMDEESQSKARNELSQAWGSDFETNVGKIKTLFQSGPGGIFESIINARLPSGVALGNDPEFLKWALQLTQQPSYSGGSSYQGSNRIREIEQFMRDNRRAYNRDPQMQAELRQLYAQRDG